MGSIPNLHPLTVHFPIALLGAALVLDLVAVLARREKMAACSGVVLIMAALGAVAAVASGLAAEDTVKAMAPSAELHDVLERHETLALVTCGMAVALAVWRLVGRLRHPAGPLRWLYLGLLAAACILVAATGHLGGEMVYGHGVGVKVRPDAEQAAPPPLQPNAETLAPQPASRAEAPLPASERLVVVHGALRRWAEKHGGRFPPKPETLVDEHYLNESELPPYDARSYLSAVDFRTDVAPFPSDLLILVAAKPEPSAGGAAGVSGPERLGLTLDGSVHRLPEKDVATTLLRQHMTVNRILARREAVGVAGGGGKASHDAAP